MCACVCVCICELVYVCVLCHIVYAYKLTVFVYNCIANLPGLSVSGVVRASATQSYVSMLLFRSGQEISCSGSLNVSIKFLFCVHMQTLQLT